MEDTETLGSGDGIPSIEPAKNKATEQDIVSLLTALVRAHYIERSTHFNQAVEFEKLFRLDKLSELKRLDELNKLYELSSLTELRSLIHLEKLSELSNLPKLDNLSHLTELDKLEELKSLRRLSELDKLKSLDTLQQTLLNHQDTLAPLEYLNQLTLLAKLDELEKLGWLAQLDKLGSLEKLDQLKFLEKLDNMNSLSQLDNLKEIKNLDQLKELDNLKSLSQLSNLQQLEGLKNLSRIDELSKLDKIDQLKELKFADRLDKLDKLDILNQKTKTLVIHQFIGFFLEFIKMVMAAVLIIVFLSQESGREIAAKVLPAVGFSNAAQVSLGLKLIMGETRPAQFQEIVEDVRNRVKLEISSAMSPGGLLPLGRRLEMIEQLLAYSFKGAGVDFKEEVRSDINAKLLDLNEKAIARLNFEMSIAHGKNDTKTEDLLREVKLLLIQKQYPQMLEKVLPNWNLSEAMTMAGIVGTTHLKLQDPGTLDEILRNNLPGHKAQE